MPYHQQKLQSNSDKILKFIAESLASELHKVNSKYEKIEGIISVYKHSIYIDGLKNCAIVDDVKTYNLIDEQKNDIGVMIKACEAELETMATTGLIVAPYYFERVAILAKKQKRYDIEVKFCELLILAHRIYNKAYKVYNEKPLLKINESPRYKSIVKRLPKAKENLKKMIQESKKRS